MNKIGFCLSGIMSLICLIGMLINTFIIGLTPTIRQIVYYFTKFNSNYKEFLPNFSSSYAVCTIFFIIGICLCIMFYRKEKLVHK